MRKYFIIISYPSVQKIASVNGVVHMKGTIIAGTIAKETSFSAVQICGWLELIARVAIALFVLLVFLACRVVIHLCNCILVAVLVDNVLDLLIVGLEVWDATEANPTNLVMETCCGCTLMPLNIWPKHRAELCRMIICDSMVFSSTDAITKNILVYTNINYLSENENVKLLQTFQGINF